MKREELLERAKAGVKEAYTKRDRLIVQTVNAIGDVDKATNLLYERLQEWYGIYFPELKTEQEKYCKIAAFFEKEAPDAEALEKLSGREKAEQIIGSVATSIGAELGKADLAAIHGYAAAVAQLFEQRRALEAYEKALADEICPNVAYLVGPHLAAKLIALAGSIDRLAVLPASTVQVLGAEKALFKHLRKNARPPKHGVLFQHPDVGGAPKWQRGRIARALATKIVIAAKADVYSKRFIAEKLKADFESRLKAVREAKQPVKSAPERMREPERRPRKPFRNWRMRW
jgi:nucleolar protein 56